MLKNHPSYKQYFSLVLKRRRRRKGAAVIRRGSIKNVNHLQQQHAADLKET